MRSERYGTPVVVGSREGANEQREGAMRWCALGVALLLAGGCGGGNGDATPDERPGTTIAVTVEGFAEEAPVPVEHTCDGADRAPAVSWSGLPPGTRSIAITLEDPDAPGGTFVHWTVAAIPSDAAGYDPAAPPAGAVQGRNDFDLTGYGGPCPPEGDPPHRYVLTVWALELVPELREGFAPAELAAILEDHAIAAGSVTGTAARG